jgi:hypothetical protein
MDAWFPKDCRQEYARAQRRFGVIFTLLAICFAGFLAVQAARGGDWMLPFGVGVVILIVAGSFLYRCPACGSGVFVYGNRCPTWSHGFLRWESGYCLGCGSRLSDARLPAGENSLVPYIVDSTLGDGQALMKIIEDTPKRFRFRLKCGFWFRLVILPAGLGALLFLCDERILDCQRAADGSVNGRVFSSVLGLRLHSRPVTDLRGVRLQDDGSVSPWHRIGLETGEGSLPFTRAYWPGFERQQQLAHQVSQFLRDQTRNRGRFVLPPGSWEWGVTGFLWLIGLGMVVNRPDEFILDRNRRRFQIIRRGMRQARLLEYPLAEIERFGITRSTELVNTASEGTRIEYFENYSIGMRLQSGVVVNLDTPGAARKLDGVGAPSRYRKKRAVANRLEQLRRSLVADSSLAASRGSVASAAMERE